MRDRDDTDFGAHFTMNTRAQRNTDFNSDGIPSDALAIRADMCADLAAPEYWRDRDDLEVSLDVELCSCNEHSVWLALRVDWTGETDRDGQFVGVSLSQAQARVLAQALLACVGMHDAAGEED